MRSTVQSKVLGQEDCRTVYTSDEISWMERCGLGHSILTCNGQAGSREPWQRSRGLLSMINKGTRALRL